VTAVTSGVKLSTDKGTNMNNKRRPARAGAQRAGILRERF
jgi:hypothetical protein